MAINPSSNANFSNIVQSNLLTFTDLQIEIPTVILEKFIDAESSKIQREGLPKPIYEFLESVYQQITIKGNHWQRDISVQLLKYLPTLDGLQFWKTNSTNTRVLGDFLISSFENFGLYEPMVNVLGVEKYEILTQIHQKLLTCLAEKTVRDLKMEDQQFFIVPSTDSTTSLPSSEQMLLAFFKRKDIWFVARFINAQGKDIDPIPMTQVSSHFLTDYTAIPRKFFSRIGQNMCLEKDLSPVNEKRIFADIFLDPLNPRLVDVLKNGKKFHEIPISDFPLLHITIRFYTGLPEYDTLKPNCISFLAKYSLENKKMVEEISLDSPMGYFIDQLNLKIDDMERLREEAFYLMEDSIEEWSKEVIDSSKYRITQVICFPKTTIEKRKAFLEILLDLSKDAENNRELIEFLYDDLETTLTIEDFEKFASKEEVSAFKKGELEPTPKLMSQILINDAMKEYRAATLLAPSENNNNVTTSNSVPVIKDEVLQKDKNAQAQVFSKYAKKEKKSSKKEQKLPSKEAPSKTAPPKQFKLTPDEKEKVKSVMQGNPMRSKDFNKFYVKILKRKMEESKQSIKKDGSHIKLHFEKTDGSSTGFTLVRKHGNKDNVGSIKSQKRSLKDLLG